ncbi:GNAT family N-acetyltransferase [Candidatus Bathyarchaeota archaeon]|nr:GNAT family N-acetyltransferase [Candidatus Bathyarchaeota archaeon]
MDVVFEGGGGVDELREHMTRVGLSLGETELRLVTERPERLILWREDGRVVGHTIWHESNTEEHPDGEPREDEDRRILEEELGVEGDFVELHEIWLGDESRGRGYGRSFFDYFESMVAGMGYRYIVYYADHPAALAICRGRGYREAYGVELDGVDGGGGVFYVLAKELP